MTPEGLRRARGGQAGPRRQRLVRRLLGEIQPYWRQILIIFLLDLLATPLLLLSPVPVKVAVDSVLGDRPLPGFLAVLVPDALTRTDVLLVAAGLQVLVVVLAQVQQLGSYVLRVRTGEALTLGVREKLFGHAQRLSLLRHDAKGSTDSVYRIQYDAMALQKVTIDGVLTTATAAVTLVATIVVIARLDWQLAVVGLAVSPLLVVLTRGYRVRVRPRYRDVKGIESDAMRVVQEALAALRVVKAFGQEDGERDRFTRRSGAGVRVRVGLAWAEGWFGLLVNLVTALGTATVLFIGVRHVQSGVLTLGELLIVISYLSQLYAPLKTISRNAASLQSSLASAERVFEFLDEEPDVPQQPRARSLPRAAGLVEFEHVSMAYDGGQEVLRDVSFRVEPGAHLGICGVTGAGKTTLVNLLARFYDPTAGRVLLDGIDLREYRLADLRRQLAIVLQDPVLFSTSIAENIRYARPDASLNDVVAAAEQAGAHEFIRELPHGYDTRVGERGMRLSGGERQRISLARAFLKGGRLLLLDEPTSSVDMRTEAKIMAAMERLMTGRTSFLIAHRLSTLERCDAWIELTHGRVVDAGEQVWNSSGCTRVPGAVRRQRPGEQPPPARGGQVAAERYGRAVRASRILADQPLEWLPIANAFLQEACRERKAPDARVEIGADAAGPYVALHGGSRVADEDEDAQRLRRSLRKSVFRRRSVEPAAQVPVEHAGRLP